MAKLIATVNVIAWCGFWAFGYIALTSQTEGGPNTLIALLLAAAGGGIGLMCWMWLVRHAEEIGYAPRHPRKLPRNPGEEEETV
ncbi:hypothetical protein SAMN05216257_101552 [Meinhardsimonia xiamenensis]|jgi:hypothetical protein|uniref:Uncharacterized protein n=1 Tax=Meinhardsimonia xiamenensis TaxID=990712 RepID=A0A1G8Z529_9RHOB|nr:hypothetical protein [Meinhardsimonia xiamenensis]PRX37528.1 hypothetical protein LV81_01307 [Meinhardsimonia xiamenensis]SDK09320.1 hypothetical protein SAMN05216257_101552 [Meinhardsimonia xiamenensis]